MTQTQVEAFQRLKASGRLAASELAVYEKLLSFPGCTRNELDLAIGHGRPNANASRRLSAMERKGVLRRGPRRHCSVTNNSCETWFAVESPPSESPRKSVHRASPARVLRTISEILRSPKAKVLPDATIDQALSVIDGAEAVS